MKRDFYYLPIITILAVIGMFLAVQNVGLKEQAETYKKEAASAQRERGDIESIVKQNRSFTLCGFQVMAKYTRDMQPIENLDLEACTTDSQTQATADTPTNGTTPAQANTNDPQRTQAPAANNDSLSSSTTANDIPQPHNRSTMQRVEDATANAIDFLWPFN